MKVRYAVQVMSRTVSAAMTMYIRLDKLPQRALPTATLLLRLNNLLDILNSSSRLGPCFKRRAISTAHPATAEEHMETLQESDAWLQRWTVGDGASIDSIRGLRQTIKGVKKVWDLCQAAGCSFLCTRRLNQDALENFFSVVRQRGGGMDNPDPIHFRHLYKHASLNHLLSAPTTSSCADDGDGLVAVLRRVAMETSVETSENPESAPPPLSGPSTESQLETQPQVPMNIRNVLSYVGGYLLRTARLGCEACKEVLLKEAGMPLADNETFMALKSYTAIKPSEVGSLLRPSEDCDAFFVACYRQYEIQAGKILLEARICERLVRCALATSEAQHLARQMCHLAALQGITATYIRLELHRTCRDLQPAAADKNQRHKTAASKKLKKLKKRSLAAT